MYVSDDNILFVTYLLVLTVRYTILTSIKRLTIEKMWRLWESSHFTYLAYCFNVKKGLYTNSYSVENFTEFGLILTFCWGTNSPPVAFVPGAKNENKSVQNVKISPKKCDGSEEGSNVYHKYGTVHNVRTIIDQIMCRNSIISSTWKVFSLHLHFALV